METSYGKKKFFSRNSAERTGHPYAKKKKKKVNIDIDLTPCTKINFKWILDLNTKMQNCKICRRKHMRQYT